MILLSLVSVVCPGAEEFQYDSHGKRDPLIPLVGQERLTSSVIPLTDIASVDDIKLEGIAGTIAGSKTAIMNGELVKENSKYGEVEIKKIMKKSVLITISGKEYTVNLPEEGEQK